MQDSLAALHQRFQEWITHRYFIRLHMTLMLAGVVLSGVLASRMLHYLGLRLLVVRYPVAVAFSYLVFFLLVRLWLAYAIRVRRKRAASSSLDLGDLSPDGSFSLSGGGGSGSAGGLSGGGGGFGGGGASGEFDGAGGGAAEVPARMGVLPLSGSGGGSAKGSGGSFDLDGDGAILLIVFVVVVAVIFGAGVYLIYHGPLILSEAAFQGAMASGLVKTSRDMHDEGWVESVFKATRIPFLLSLLGAGAFGWVAHHYCPQAATVHEVFRTCVFR